MTGLQEMRQGLGQLWQHMVEGWQQFSRKAGRALTRFSRPRRMDAGESALWDARSIGWSVLAAEVFVDEDQVVVRMEVPGMRRRDFDIRLDGDLLVVSGEKRFEQESRRGRYHVSECAYGRFERAIALPVPVDGEGAKAKYRKGVLRVELPRLPGGSGVRTVPID